MNYDERRADAIRLLERLATAHGAPGAEGAVRHILRECLGPAAATDRSGNVMLARTGTDDAPRIMLTAHMDEVGFVVQSVTRNGLLRFLPLGGWWSHTLLAQRVVVRTREGRDILGVVASKPPHFLQEGERDKLMKVDDMFIDVGATDASDVRFRFGIRPGDTIVPESPFTVMHNPDLLLCKAFDNRVGTALMVQTMSMIDGLHHPNTVIGVGTVQEELGTRGAQTAAHTVKPDLAIVLEGTPADDLPGTDESERQGALGHGVQIRVMDPSAIMNRTLVDFAVDTSESLGIPCQIAVRKTGGTDAKAIHIHGSGVPTLVLGIPARYIHTHNSIISIRDYLGALDLILELLQRMDRRLAESCTAFAD